MLENATVIFIVVLSLSIGSFLICIIALLIAQAKEKALEKELAEEEQGEDASLNEIIHSLEQSFIVLSETTNQLREKADGIMDLSDQVLKDSIKLSEPVVYQQKDQWKA